jgi:hypothetical protein
MNASQQLKPAKIFIKASPRQRLIAAGIFVVFFIYGLFFWLCGQGKIDTGRWINPCGMKQKYNIPCPTCGMTTSTITFAQGKVSKAFYIQPAAALFCCLLVISAFLALFMAVFGVYFISLKRFFDEIRLKYIIIAILIIIMAGWSVTLVRALVSR